MPYIDPPGNVVLLHGLARSSNSMQPLAIELSSVGYRVCNIAYPSRKHLIQTLANDFVLPEILNYFRDNTRPIHFVTHSLGGIIVRQLAASFSPIMFGRIVMLAPPNGGSEIVDKLGNWTLFKMINGPAGRQLGTAETDLPTFLGPAPFELGIIAGNRSINILLSCMIEGEDDGKVSIENAKLAGMDDFLIMPVSHPFIMQNKTVIKQSIHFLQNGRFYDSYT